MQTVHRAASYTEACSASETLSRCGIASHIADEELWGDSACAGAKVIRVMVDNRSLDRARRSLMAWKKERGTHSE